MASVESFVPRVLSLLGAAIWLAGYDDGARTGTPRTL